MVVNRPAHDGFNREGTELNFNGDRDAIYNCAHVWTDAAKRYKIIAYGKNLTDNIGYDAGATGERDAGNIKAADGTITPVIQGIRKTFSVTPPRTYGIELQYKF